LYPRIFICKFTFIESYLPCSDQDMSSKGVSWQNRVAMILSLSRVGNSKFKDPAALIESPKQTRSIPAVLIRPKPKHHPANKKSRNPVEAFPPEVGMCVAVRPFLILTCIRAKLVSRRIEFMFGVCTIRHARRQLDPRRWGRQSGNQPSVCIIS
jgi:hypothetical protein